MTEMYLRFLNVLSKKRKYQLFLVFLFISLNGLAEMISLASVIPFLSIINNPKNLWNHPFTQKIAPILNLSSPEELIIPATILFISSAIISGIFRTFNIWFQGYVGSEIGQELGKKAIFKKINQPYNIHINENSSEVIARLNGDINCVVLFFEKSFYILTAFIISIFILTTIFLIEWKVSLILGFLFISIYFLISSVTRSKLKENGKKLKEANISLIKTIQESVGSIRDIILSNSQGYYVREFSYFDGIIKKKRFKNYFYTSSPRYLMESVGLTLIGVFSVVMVKKLGQINSIIPVLGAFALGAQKLLPSFQLIYSSVASLFADKYFLESALRILEQPDLKVHNLNNLEPYKLKNSIVIQALTFKYPNQKRKVLDNVNLEIKKGERIGLIGKTGSGKSTVLDLIIGLIEPSGGTISVDNKNLHKLDIFKKSWLKNIGHVPQNIFLTDDSICSNIALGIPKEEIDIKRIKEVIKLAQLESFINELKYGIYTIVGERGSRLSGGQRQRIGIARALYHSHKNLLVLDEATSALDKKTESEIITSINNLSRDLTIIVISHRLSALNLCDKIFQLKKAKLKEIKDINEINLYD